MNWIVNLFCFNYFSSRTATRRTGAAVSYKEASDEQTDSSDLCGDAEAEPEPEPEDHSETIERVLGHRRGKKGGKLTTPMYHLYII